MHPITPSAPSASSVLDVLTRGYELLRDPNAWTSRVAARDARGRRCDPRGELAVRFCSTAALARVAGDDEAALDGALHALADAAVAVVGDLAAVAPRYLRSGLALDRTGIRDWTRVVALNDGTDHATVCAMWRLAIAAATIGRELDALAGADGWTETTATVSIDLAPLGPGPHLALQRAMARARSAGPVEDLVALERELAVGRRVPEPVR